MSEHGMGWLKDSLDPRDYPLTLVRSGQPLPSRVSLRPQMPALYDQGQLGSCTANAIALAYRFAQIKQGLADFDPARLMIYYDERAMEGTVRSDAGAQIRDGMKVLHQQGACAEALWPYDVTKFTKKPPKACYTDGLKHLSVRFETVPQDVDAFRAVLASGYPIICGALLYPEFESDAVAKTGHVPMPTTREKPIGGHAFLISGYDDVATSQPWEDPNSWGPGWGDGGYFSMPRPYLLNPKLASDFWCLRIVEAA